MMPSEKVRFLIIESIPCIRYFLKRLINKNRILSYCVRVYLLANARVYLLTIVRVQRSVIYGVAKYTSVGLLYSAAFIQQTKQDFHYLLSKQTILCVRT
jgi:hypothetical protein